MTHIHVVVVVLLYYFTHTEKYHKLSRHVLHECCRHECNAALMTSDISYTCEIIEIYHNNMYMCSVDLLYPWLQCCWT